MFSKGYDAEICFGNTWIRRQICKMKGKIKIVCDDVNWNYHVLDIEKEMLFRFILNSLLQGNNIIETREFILFQTGSQYCRVCTEVALCL